MRTLVLLASLSCVACQPLAAQPEPLVSGADACRWSAAVNRPFVLDSGDHCAVRTVEPPLRIDLTLSLAGGHTLRVDTDDRIAGDPYGRVEPAVVVDGEYVPCGSGVTGSVLVDIRDGKWSAHVDYSGCEQEVFAELSGSVPR